MSVEMDGQFLGLARGRGRDLQPRGGRMLKGRTLRHCLDAGRLAREGTGRWKHPEPGAYTRSFRATSSVVSPIPGLSA